MNEPKYRPTGEGTPNPALLTWIAPTYRSRWVPVTEALPPPKINVTVMVRGDNCPAYGWLKFSAGDRNCPHFVVPQLAAMGPRNADIGKPKHAQFREDVTHWWSDTYEGLPHRPSDWEDASWGLNSAGWETREEALNPKQHE